MKYQKKNLFIENISVENIAKKYGTPTYCYSYSRLKENILNFKKNFKSISPLICFAVKSNTNVNLINEISKFGFGADVVSVGEMMMALKAGVSPKKIVFSGVGKTTNEISYAIDKKILLINAESKSEVVEINRVARQKNKIEPKLNNDVLKVFDLTNSVNSKKSYGGTSFDNIKKMILKYKKQK